MKAQNPLLMILLVLLGVVAGANLIPATAQDQDAAIQGDLVSKWHKLLKADEGIWEATISYAGGEFTGTESNKLVCGGLWLVTQFEADFMGQPFEGFGATGYDVHKKKFVGTWMDSMTSSMSLSEGTSDKEGKKTTMKVKSFDPMAGAETTQKHVTQRVDANTRILTMYMPGEDGVEVEGMKITYKRRQ